MNIEGKIAYIAVTEKGKRLGRRVQDLVGKGDVYTTAKLQEEGVRCIEGKLKEYMAVLFKSYDTLIFIMATGIVVRSIAPYIESKFSDPAILVMDEEGHHVISLLSGHMGGANETTLLMSQLINADPVITTSTDVNNKAALDNIAKGLNAYIANFREAVKDINYRLVHNQKIGLYLDGDYQVDERGFTRLCEVEDIKKQLETLEAVVYITHHKRLKFNHPNLIKVVPRELVLGMGCKKGTSVSHMLESFESYCNKNNIDTHAFKVVGSIEVKKDEVAMQSLAQQLEVPFEIFTKEQIIQVEHLFAKSEFVKKNVGVYSVAEPVAYLLSEGHLEIKREAYCGITFALGRCQK